MSVGERFLQKCLNTDVLHDPWPYQIIEDTFSLDVFEKLKNQCEQHLEIKTDKLIHIHPSQFKEYNIDF